MKAILAGLLLVAALVAGFGAQDQWFPPDVRSAQGDGIDQDQYFPPDVRMAQAAGDDQSQWFPVDVRSV